jgi:NAD(P)-dependent dehydrogenase (short-subunit alcohol dehydrogenase family)
VREYANGKPAADWPVGEFMVPVDTVLKAQFITAAAAARQMLKHGSGVIIFLTGSPARPHTPATSGIGAAFGAVENLTRHLANSARPACEWFVCGPPQTPARARSRT